ncbi:hypothetical protein HHI36_001076 [Cryptolaemus montrouzieri]|uniref:Proteasome assembly chaperone 4 n=1 Tax=Cryptolaemus montrouzieri TaxID=559131 RepID=A0ABD2P6R8_9CUCU
MVNDRKPPKLVESSFSTHIFSDDLQGTKILFQVIKMLDSCIIFINDQNNLKFVDLSLAIQSRFEREPLTTNLVGHGVDNSSVNLANKLNKRLKKLVYLSLNVEGDRLLLPGLEKRLYEEIKSRPEKF